MTNEPTTEQWNAKFVTVTYAVHGEISPNVRQITLDWREGLWEIAVVLEKDDPAEIERLHEDFFTEIEAADGQSNLRGRVDVDAAVRSFPPFPTRTIYWRKED